MWYHVIISIDGRKSNWQRPTFYSRWIFFFFNHCLDTSAISEQTSLLLGCLVALWLRLSDRKSHKLAVCQVLCWSSWWYHIYNSESNASFSSLYPKQKLKMIIATFSLLKFIIYYFSHLPELVFSLMILT